MKTALSTLIILTICMSTSLFAQVEHNYEVGPQSVNCDTLDVTTYDFEDALSTIERTTFRYQQQFKISRTYGVMSARFFSCDGLTGYLIMKVDKKDFIFLDVPEIKWKGLIGSADINGYYDLEIKKSYDFIKEGDE